jgi:hypothetical protein
VGPRAVLDAVVKRDVLVVNGELIQRPRMRGAIPLLPQNAFMGWCLDEAQGQLYLLSWYEGVCLVKPKCFQNFT